MSSGEQGPRWFHPTSPSSIFLVFLIHSPCHPWVLGGERERTGQAPGKRGVERASGPRREGPSARVSLSLSLPFLRLRLARALCFPPSSPLAVLIGVFDVSFNISPYLVSRALRWCFYIHIAPHP